MSAPLGFDRVAVDALGWTLLHFVWQGVLIAMAFAGIDRLLSRARANVRYLVGCGTLLVMLLIPIGTFVVVRDAGPLVAPVSGRSVHTPGTATSHGAPRPSQAAKPVRVVTPAPERVLLEPLRPASLGPSLREAFTGWAGSARFAAIFPWLVVAWATGVLALS